MRPGPGSLPPVYTFGYSGRRLAGLIERIEALDAILMDIREVPWSKEEEWRKAHLEEALGYRYWHNAWWGNPGRKEGTIRLANWRTGLVTLKYALCEEQQPVILMCGCRAEAGCHRGHIGKRLREQGYTVEELEW